MPLPRGFREEYQKQTTPFWHHLGLFSECSTYTDIRRDLLICVYRFGIKIYLALLTRGSQNLSYQAYKFIRRSTRFLIVHKLITTDNMMVVVTKPTCSVLFYMCYSYWYTYINVHALFHIYICYNCYVIQRRRLHKRIKLVSDPFCFYEQI